MAQISITIPVEFNIVSRSPTTPILHCYNIGLGCSAFARHYLRNHYLFSLPAGNEMFQFPAFALWLAECHTFNMTGFPIRIFTDQRLFAPPRNFSQLITSFVAFRSQGIHRLPLSCFFFFCCSVVLFDYPSLFFLLFWTNKKVLFSLYNFLLLCFSFFQYVKDLFF